jgi:hypothetical protein
MRDRSKEPFAKVTRRVLLAKQLVPNSQRNRADCRVCRCSLRGPSTKDRPVALHGRRRWDNAHRSRAATKLIQPRSLGMAGERVLRRHGGSGSFRLLQGCIENYRLAIAIFAPNRPTSTTRRSLFIARPWNSC